MSAFTLLLAIHVCLAVALLVPSVLLPFVLRGRGSPPARRAGALGALLWLQANGTLAIGAGLAVSGTGLLVMLGPALLAQPWLLLALAVYAGNLAVAFFVQRPTLRQLLPTVSGTGYDERERWRRRARRQRYLSYLMAAGVGLIAFLMSAKPQLW